MILDTQTIHVTGIFAYIYHQNNQNNKPKWMIWDMLPHWRAFKMPVPFKTVCCLYTWTFQFGCQMVPLCVSSPFCRDLFWHPDWKVRLYVVQDIFSIPLSIYLTCDLSHHPTSLTMINSLDLKGRCPMTSLQKNWKLHRRSHVFFFPTCQVRVVRFYVRLFSSFFSFSSFSSFVVVLLSFVVLLN